jgi:hypothetical protein
MVRPFPPHVSLSYAAELFIDKRDEAVPGRRVTILPRLE